jgi:hypothetical protein
MLSVVVSLSLILCSCGKSNEAITQRDIMEFEERTIPVSRYGKDNKPLGNNFGIPVKGIAGKAEISLASIKKLVTEDQCNITEAFYYDKYDKAFIGLLKEESVKVEKIERIRLICDNENLKPTFTPKPTPTPKPSLTPTPSPTATERPVAREIQISYINENKEVIKQETLPVKADEGKAKVNINTFGSVIPKDKCNNITGVFYISEGTRKALTDEDVTLDEIEGVEFVCEEEEINPTPIPTPTPAPAAKEEKYSWGAIAVFTVVAIVVVGTVLYIIKCVGGGKARYTSRS